MTLSPATTQQLERALRGLQYGTIQLVVHEGRVVRIERLERIRLTDPSEALSDTVSQPTAVHGGSAHGHREG